MTPEVLGNLRYRFDTGNGPITMGELDMLIEYAEESCDYIRRIDDWFQKAPQRQTP